MEKIKDNIFVHYIDIDANWKESVIQNDDNTYSIFINARLSHQMQIEAYNHALKHIEEDDFDKFDVQNIEARAHA